MSKEFSQPFPFLTILTSEAVDVTLHDIQTKYNTEDVYKLLEIVDAHNTILEEHRKAAEKERGKK